MAAGFSMYNRGKNLKKSLINPGRVKEYLQKMEQEKTASASLGLAMDQQLISLEDQSEFDLSKANNEFSAMISMPQVPKAIAIRNADPDLCFLQDNHIDEDK